MTTLKTYIDQIPTMIPTSITQISGVGALASMNTVSLSSTAITGVLPATKLGSFTGDATNSGYTLTLANSGVIPGNYTNANLTVDAKGRVTAATNGTSTSPITTISASTTLDQTHGTVLVDASSGAVALALPSGAGYIGKVYRVKKIDSTPNSVTLIGTIDGATNYSTAIQYDFATIQYNGTAWFIIA